MRTHLTWRPVRVLTRRVRVRSGSSTPCSLPTSACFQARGTKRPKHLRSPPNIHDSARRQKRHEGRRPQCSGAGAIAEDDRTFFLTTGIPWRRDSCQRASVLRGLREGREVERRWAEVEDHVGDREGVRVGGAEERLRGGDVEGGERRERR